MKSRMEKYYDENNQYVQRRTSRNSDLYKEISNSDIDDFSMTSNAKVIGENDSNNINIDRLKEILEKNYQRANKRNRVNLAPNYEEIPIELEETREYDINAILEKAREEKEINYERERLKKIRDTQYDILKNLNLDEEEEKNKAAHKKTKEELLNLINTITENELQKTKMDPLDILSDLKGHENTTVLGAKEMTEAIQIANQEAETKEKLESLKKAKEELKAEMKDKMDDSFYTNSLSFTQSDFDDFNDLKEDVASNKIILRILIVLVAIAIIIGCVILLNNGLNLGLF